MALPIPGMAIERPRTDLERSPTYMRALERYVMARAYLERAARAA